MKYRFLGNQLQFVKYEITTKETINGEEESFILTAADEAERDELLKLYPDAEVTEIDNSGFEWLEGMKFTQEQLKAGELEKAIEMGEEGYKIWKEESDPEYRVSVLEDALIELASIIGGE